MLVFNLIGVFLVVAFFNAVAALECNQCFDFNSCSGTDKDKTVQCSNQTTQEMFDKTRLFYPTLTESSVFSGSFQCASLNFTPQGYENPQMMLRGCLFETKDGLCKMDVNIQNGNFSCRACNTDRCNSGAALGWSLLLMAASLVASSWVAK